MGSFHVSGESNKLQGGLFEFHQGTRCSEKDPWEFDKVKSIMAGDTHGVASVDDSCKPGCLIIFAGRECLHRVTPVQGDTPRINAILHFSHVEG